jgi:hypothetical protein
MHEIHWQKKKKTGNVKLLNRRLINLNVLRKIVKKNNGRN